MIKKLWEWICLVMGVTPPGEAKPVDKWAGLRAQHEAWEREQAEKREREEDESARG
jgi:hypothetical protein